MSTSEVFRTVRPDTGGLDERTSRVAADVKKRAEATRDDVAKRTEATREQLAALAGDVGDELGERATAARELLVDRYHQLEEDLPIEEVSTKAQLNAWRALQSGLSALLTLPALAVRGLGALSTFADDVADRGADVSERGRELVAAVPPSASERRRRRRKTAGVAAIGFLVGLVTGWVLAGRRQTMVTYEPPMPASWDQAPATSQAELLDVRSEAERPEPGRGV